MRHYPLCCVHLDFHTSPDVPDVGENFSSKQFAAQLRQGNVEEITLFAKCHHGYCYYPTRVGRMHPNLKKDLLGEELKVCRELGIKVSIYITMGWSAADVEAHPEWQVISYQTGKPLNMQDGLPVDEEEGSGDAPRPFCSWKQLCSAGEYGRHIEELTREVCERYRPDGLFFDICCLELPCVCESCKRGMRKRGLDPEKYEDARAYMIAERLALFHRLRKILWSYTPEGTIFFNSGGAEMNQPEYHEAMTHFELEDLPTAGGGYDKLSNRSKYFSKLDKDFLGMTGKFHYNWGEFGSYKSKEALRYECAAMMTNGARISIGDHMHPCGELDKETYLRIGHAFHYAKQIEPFCLGKQETSRLGLVLSYTLSPMTEWQKFCLRAAWIIR